MPKKYYKKKPQRYRNYKKRYSKSKAQAQGKAGRTRWGGNGISRTLSLNRTAVLSNKFKAILPYSEYGITLTPSSGTLVTHIFSANSLYDPNVTTTGHQPLGFDQLMLMYQYYTVIGAKIRVTFNNVNNQDPALIGIYCKNDTATSTNESRIEENGDGTFAVMGAVGSANAVQTIEYQCAPAKFLAISNPLSDDSLRGSASAAPANEVFFHIVAGPQDNASLLAAIHCNVYIEYVAIFHEPIALTQS